MDFNDPEYKRLCDQIGQAQKSSEFNYQHGKKIAKCAALLLREALKQKGFTFEDGETHLCGTGQAALQQYLRLAFGNDFRSNLLGKYCYEILSGISDLKRDGENVSEKE